MSARGSFTTLEPGREVFTACGSRIHLEPDTPRSTYRGRPVFFCLPACKTDFENDPATSCMADQIAREQPNP